MLNFKGKKFDFSVWNFQLKKSYLAVKFLGAEVIISLISNWVLGIEWFGDSAQCRVPWGEVIFTGVTGVCK